MSAFLDTLRRIAVPEALSDEDLADLGLNRDDYRILVKGGPGARNRLVAMARTFGLSEADIDKHRGVALDLAEACATCGEARTCQKAIEGRGELPVDRCPNAAIYRMLAAET